MRSQPACWNTTLTKLGFRRRRIQSLNRSLSVRRPQLKQLEPRQLLSITVNTTQDQNNGIGDGVISLREAIAYAPSYGNQVNFDSSLNGGRLR